MGEILHATSTNAVPLMSPEKYGTSAMRWYCLAVVTAISTIQGAIWANFGPISPAVKSLFGWGDGSIALLANWGPICYILVVAPSSWLLDSRDGLWRACVLASVLVLCGSLLRCIHVTGDGVGSLLMHAAQALNGLAGPIAMSAGPVLSAQWFAPTERTRSTAIVGVSNCAHSEPQTPDQQITFHWSDLLPPPWTDGGTALVFVLGPALVPAEPAARVASRLKGYMFGEAIASAALLAAAVCMPRQPPFAPCGQARPKPAPPPPAWHLAPQLTSPSVEWPVILLLATGRARSATVQRTSMRDGFCRLIRLP